MSETKLSLTKETGLRILITGNSAREHNLGRKILESDRVSKVFTSVGAMISERRAVTYDGLSRVELYPHNSQDPISQALALSQRHDIDLIVCGPEDPLIAGLANRAALIGKPVFGPRSELAKIEGSKAWAKMLMLKHGIPTASAEILDVYGDIEAYEKAVGVVRSLASGPLVLKADGPALGKGAIVCNTREEALEALVTIAHPEHRKFGPSGDVVVVEEKLSGVEGSGTFIVGGGVVECSDSRDYKQVGPGDSENISGNGPNTGGMGSHSPSGTEGVFDQKKVFNEITIPLVQILKEETGHDYIGFFYPGIMWVNENGVFVPKVLEVNGRIGHPENTVVLPRLKTDIVEIMLASVNRRLAEVAYKVEWSDEAFVDSEAVSGGYPNQYKKGIPIDPLFENSEDDTGYILMGGVKWLCGHGEGHLGPCGSGHYQTDGGRVASAIGRGTTLAEARANSYKKQALINFEGKHFRSDIADPNLLDAEKQRIVNSR